MKGFALDERGDLIIENGVIQMIHGVDLTTQTLASVWNTQKGEWFFNEDEGIEINEILGKKRYAKHNNGLDNQYIEEIAELKSDKAQNEAETNALNEKLAKRLDGVL